MTVFDYNALAKAVNETLTTTDVPVAHRGAFVTVADGHGVKAVVAVKVGDTWKIQGVVEQAWHGGVNAGVSVKATW